MTGKKADAQFGEFMEKATACFAKYDIDGTGEVSAWDIKKALTEMGHPIRDDMLFDMLRSNDGERSEVSFDKFLQLCRTNISDEGGGGWGKQRRIRKDLAEAWEAAGGKRDLTGEVDARSLKRIFDLFELKTGVESLISADTSMVEYAEFCALLERCFCMQHVYMFVLFLFWKREDTECSTIAKSPETAEGDVIQTRSIATPDMRRPFEVCVCVCVCVWYLNTECDFVGLKCSCDGGSKDEEKENELIYRKKKTK